MASSDKLYIFSRSQRAGQCANGHVRVVYRSCRSMASSGRAGTAGCPKGVCGLQQRQQGVQNVQKELNRSWCMKCLVNNFCKIDKNSYFYCVFFWKFYNIFCRSSRIVIIKKKIELIPSLCLGCLVPCCPAMEVLNSVWMTRFVQRFLSELKIWKIQKWADKRANKLLL